MGSEKSIYSFVTPDLKSLICGFFMLVRAKNNATTHGPCFSPPSLLRRSAAPNGQPSPVRISIYRGSPTQKTAAWVRKSTPKKMPAAENAFKFSGRNLKTTTSQQERSARPWDQRKNRDFDRAEVFASDKLLTCMPRHAGTLGAFAPGADMASGAWQRRQPFHPPSNPNSESNRRGKSRKGRRSITRQGKDGKLSQLFLVSCLVLHKNRQTNLGF